MSKNRLNISKNIRIFVSRLSFGWKKGRQGGFNRFPFFVSFNGGDSYFKFESYGDS